MANRRPAADDVRARLIATVERGVAALAAEAVTMLRERFPAYAGLTAEQLHPGVEGDLRRALEALRDRRAPTPEELAGAAAVGEGRAREGVPLDVMLQGFQAVAQLAWAGIKSAADGSGVSPADVLELAEDVWAWVNVVTVEAANAHRRVDEAKIQQSERLRISLVDSLLGGGLTAGQARSALVSLGLPPGESCVAFRARPVAPLSLARVLRLLDGRWTHLPVAAMERDGDIVGFMSGEAVLNASDLRIGLGRAGPVADLPRSLDVAGRALDAIVALGLTGAHTLTDLGLRAVVVSEDEVGDALVTALLAPLQASRGMAADLVTSVRAYLACDANVDQAAQTVGVHPNTLRYRLRRFEALSGTDLERVDDVVRVWWALQRELVQRHRTAALSERSDHLGE
jgi:hypothetical protein